MIDCDDQVSGDPPPGTSRKADSILWTHSGATSSRFRMNWCIRAGIVTRSFSKDSYLGNLHMAFRRGNQIVGRPREFVKSLKCYTKVTHVDIDIYVSTAKNGFLTACSEEASMVQNV